MNQLIIVFWACLNVYVTIGQETLGPICYSCDRTDNPEQCRNSKTCSVDQVCSVQEVSAPHGDVYFWSGCEDLDICEDLSYTGTLNQIIGKRQVSSQQSRCVYCCNTDLCNKNCTSFVNLALHKPAFESSVYVGVYGNPELAVDGDTTKNYYKGSCMHTQNMHYPWWAVDLQNDYRITKVKLFERGDAADGRSFHLTILVSSYNATTLDKDSPMFTKCGYYYGHSSDGNVITIDCPRNTHGRWVRVQQSDPHNEYLHLCEVEVYGF